MYQEKSCWRKMSRSIAKTNDLSYAGAVVTSNLEVSRNKEAFRKELLWR